MQLGKGLTTAMPKRQMARGGRYTRPLRGFRSKSHYRDRLRKRGLTPKDVRMESLDALRKRQGHIPGPIDGSSSSGPVDASLQNSVSGISLPGIVSGMAYNDEVA